MKKEREALDNQSECDKRETGTEPSEEGPFIGQMVPEVRIHALSTSTLIDPGKEYPSSQHSLDSPLVYRRHFHSPVAGVSSTCFARWREDDLRSASHVECNASSDPAYLDRLTEIARESDGSIPHLHPPQDVIPLSWGR